MTAFQFVQIWNNQLDQLAEGTTYVFPFPCAFIEIISPSTWLPLGQGYSVGDIIIRIHIGHEEYDAGGGDFEQNVNVFTLRDAVITQLNNFQPTGCSSLMKVNESQDYMHTNLYHYYVDFKASFIDDRGCLDVQNPPATGVITELVENVVVDIVNLEDKFDETFDLTFNFYY